MLKLELNCETLFLPKSRSIRFHWQWCLFNNEENNSHYPTQLHKVIKMSIFLNIVLSERPLVAEHDTLYV